MDEAVVTSFYVFGARLFISVILIFFKHILSVQLQQQPVEGKFTFTSSPMATPFGVTSYCVLHLSQKSKVELTFNAHDHMELRIDYILICCSSGVMLQCRYCISRFFLSLDMATT